MQGSYVTYLSFAATVESLLFVWAPFFIVDFNFLSSELRIWISTNEYVIKVMSMWFLIEYNFLDPQI